MISFIINKVDEEQRLYSLNINTGKWFNHIFVSPKERNEEEVEAREEYTRGKRERKRVRFGTIY
jgi:hypothetical protein